jgi:hypothetical protein
LRKDIGKSFRELFVDRPAAAQTARRQREAHQSQKAERTGHL